MIKEALQWVAENFGKADRFEHGRSSWVKMGAEWKEFQKLAPLFKPTFLSLGSFAHFVANDEDDSGDVYVGAGAVSCRFDDDFAVARMQFCKTREFQFLDSLERVNSWDQKPFIEALRTRLGGVVEAKALLAAVRHVKFADKREGEAAIQHGRENMSKSITRSLIGATEIPESVSLGINVYNELEFKRQVECVVSVDAEAQKFTLTPVSGQLLKAEQETMEEIAKRIEILLPNATVYRGVETGI